MPAKQQTRILSVRLPEAKLRRLKSRAAARGQNLQQAINNAVDLWFAQPEASNEKQEKDDAAFWALRGCLAGEPVWEDRYQDKRIEWEHDRRWLGELAGPPPRRQHP